MSTLEVCVTVLREVFELSGDYLIDQLEAHDTLYGKMSVEGQMANVNIPFHAIDYAIVNGRGVTPVTPKDDNCGGEQDLPMCEDIMCYSGLIDGSFANGDSYEFWIYNGQGESIDLNFVVDGVQIEDFEVSSSDPSVVSIERQLSDISEYYVAMVTPIKAAGEDNVITLTITFPDKECKFVLYATTRNGG